MYSIYWSLTLWVISIENMMMLAPAFSFPLFLSVSNFLTSSLLTLDFGLNICQVLHYSDVNIVVFSLVYSSSYSKPNSTCWQIDRSGYIQQGLGQQQKKKQNNKSLYFYTNYHINSAVILQAKLPDVLLPQQKHRSMVLNA